jgi:Na+-driven multidrug efflux pump
MAENLQKFSFYRNILGMIVNILLNYFLIPKYGASGAASASVLARLAATVGFMSVVPLLRNQVLLIIRSINPFNMFFNFKD